MSEEFFQNVTEVNKVNQRIKEYLWKEWYLLKVKKN